MRAISASETADWVARGVWRGDSLLHVLDQHAASHPERLAVADQHRRFTYAELAEASERLAGWLRGLDLPPGAVVAVQSASCALIPLVHFACNRVDLTFLPLSDAWRARETAHLLRKSGARVAIVPVDSEGFSHVSMVNELRPELPDLVLTATFGPSGADVDLGPVIESFERHRGTGLTSQTEPRMCMVTSGTSGLPKISLYTDNNLWFFLSTYMDTLQLQGPAVFASIAPANTGSTGYIFPVLAPLLFGASSVMLEHWNPVAALGLVEAENVNVVVAVPTQLIKMLEVSESRPYRGRTLQAMSNAGAPMPPDVAARIEKAFECAVLPMYGATDGGVPAMTTVRDAPDKRYHSVGRIIEHTDFRIATADGDPVHARGERGEVQWWSPMKTLGYLNDDDKTGAAFTDDGLYRSGDLGVIDEDGYLHIVGRAKDLIIRGGQNISPREIEDVVIEMDQVIECAAIGVPDTVYGERVCLCVVAKSSGISLTDIAEHLQRRGLAHFMIPEQLVEFEEFPSNSGGKVSKADLRQLILETASAE